MVTTAKAAEMTHVMREFGASLETQGRRAGTSVRTFAESGVSEVYWAPTNLLTWFAGAMAASATFLRPVKGHVVPEPRLVIVERAKTRC